MQSSTRIMVNTLAQYIRTIINIVLSLYSSRLILDILGISDFGIYSLIAGVVSLLSFITDSLVSGTQRFLSYNQKKGNIENLKIIFSNSVLIHIVVGLFFVFFLVAFTPLLFNGFLNIPINRLVAAKYVYWQVICMVYISLLSAPYRALLVSRENIVYTSIVDVAYGTIKLISTILLMYITCDKLIAYGWLMLFATFFNLMAFLVYSHIKYEECIFPRLKFFSKSYIKELFSFTGWILFSVGCVTMRTQGVAIILNKIVSTTINAAYGIGSQLSGMISIISTSLNNAIAPQLIASEGKGDRNLMWKYAQIESKFAFLLLAMVGVPTLFEMQTILDLWLLNVPEYARLFGSTFLMMQMVDMLTTGLSLANRAIGNVAIFTFFTYFPKLLVIPLACFALRCSNPITIVCLLMFLIEFLCMIIRIPLLKDEKGFNPKKYFFEVIIKTLPPVISSVILCFLISYFIESTYRIIATFIISISVFLLVTFKIALTKEEKQKIISTIKSVTANLRINKSKKY